MNLIDFYNSVFLPEIEMMVRQTNKASFIFTPIREQNLKKTKGNTPLPPICQFSSFGKPIFSKGNNYQKEYLSFNLVKNHISMTCWKWTVKKAAPDIIHLQKEETYSKRFDFFLECIYFRKNKIYFGIIYFLEVIFILLSNFDYLIIFVMKKSKKSSIVASLKQEKS